MLRVLVHIGPEIGEGEEDEDAVDVVDDEGDDRAPGTRPKQRQW